MDLADLPFATACVQAQLLRAGDVSPVELVEQYLARIDEYNPELGAYVDVAHEQARQAARAAQTRLGRSDPPPFLGVPASIKELNDAAGMSATLGLAAYRGRVAERDDAVVRRLRSAGFLVLGKTTAPALGVGCVTEPAGFPPARNPWDPARTPGGSSGGAAVALAAGLCAVSQGSDGGGSIRIPAAWCGLVGLKPSRGRVSAAPKPSHLVSTSGPIGRSVRDVAAVLDVMSGPEPGDGFALAPPSTPFADDLIREPGPLKIALSLGGRDVEPDYAAALRRTAELLESLGHFVEEANPDPSWARVIEQTLPDSGAPGLAAVIEALPTRDGLDGLIEAIARHSQRLSAERYVSTEAELLERARRVLVFLSDYDALLSPTVAKSPPQIGEHRELDVVDLFETWESYAAFTTMWNWTGQPAITLPAGLDRYGLPIGMQLVGRPADDAGLLRLAAQLEAAQPSNHLRPPDPAPRSGQQDRSQGSTT